MPYFNSKNNIFFICCAFAVVFSSCVSSKKLTYLQYDEIIQSEVNNSYKTVFKPDDLLQITISSQDIEAAKPFNLPAVTFSASNNTVIGQPQQQSYLIDGNGYIDFPILGMLKVGGLSREELTTLFKNKLYPSYIKKDITVNIRISNFKITVQGDVKKPGSFVIPNERVTILDAIGLAGDLNISGRRDNILVIREENGEKKEYRFNLLSKRSYTSPVYYLQQNDVVYVEQNFWKNQTASSNQNTGLFVSIGGLIITIIAVLTR